MANKSLIKTPDEDKYFGFREMFETRKTLPRNYKSKILRNNKDKIIEWYTRHENPLTTAQIAERLNLAECTIQLGVSNTKVVNRLKRMGLLSSK